MILIADSGSTKCDWMGVDGGTGMWHTQGINAALHTLCEIRNVLATVPETVRPERICFYGAGCGESFPEASSLLRELLAERFDVPVLNVEVHSDLLGAARALLGHKEGIACILGTGSNSCYYDGQRIVQRVPPLGYILGDEGSGAVLGRKLLNGLLKGRFDERLLAAFYEEYGLDYEGVIRRVYREPQANRFLASLAPFIRKHTDDVQMRGLVLDAFGEFAEYNLSRYPQAEAAFTGGVAATFAAELREALERDGYRVGRITASPAEGLIEYHERR